MKINEKNEAIILRKQGFSLREISKKLNVSKGSVSYWICDIEPGKKYIERLRINRLLGYEKQRLTRIAKNKEKSENRLYLCKADVKNISERDFFIAGIMLYAGEGTKRRAPQGQRVEFTNSDPKLAQIFVRFLMQICGVALGDIHLRLFLYNDQDENKAKRMWSRALKIPMRNFTPTQFRISNDMFMKKKSQHGTLHVEVYRKELFQKIIGWIDAFHSLSGCGSIG